MNKIIIDGQEFNIPQELVDQIKSVVSSGSKEEEMEKFFLECFNGCEIVLKDVFVYYKKDGKVIMEQDLKNEYFWFDYDKFWSVFYVKFDLDYNKTQAFLKTMLDKHLKLGSYTI